MQALIAHDNRLKIAPNIDTFVYRLLISTPLSVESGSFEGSPGLISQRTYSDSNLLKSTGV